MTKREFLVLGALVIAVGCAPTDGASPTVGDWRAWADAQAQTQTDAQAILIECFRDQGWEASVTDFGLEIRIPEGQFDALQSTRAHCDRVVEELGYGPKEFAEQDIANFYGYMVDRYQCLSEAGYDLPPPPSLEVYLETYHASEDHWDPYGHVPHHRVRDALDACPQDL